MIDEQKDGRMETALLRPLIRSLTEQESAAPLPFRADTGSRQNQIQVFRCFRCNCFTPAGVTCVPRSTR